MEAAESFLGEQLKLVQPVINFDQFIKYSPKTIWKLVGKRTVVTLVDNTSREGYLYSVDPQFHHLVLLQLLDVTGGDQPQQPSSLTPIVVFSHAAKSIKCTYWNSLAY